MATSCDALVFPRGTVCTIEDRLVQIPVKVTCVEYGSPQSHRPEEDNELPAIQKSFRLFSVYK